MFQRGPNGRAEEKENSKVQNFLYLTVNAQWKLAFSSARVGHSSSASVSLDDSKAQRCASSGAMVRRRKQERDTLEYMLVSLGTPSTSFSLRSRHPQIIAGSAWDTLEPLIVSFEAASPNYWFRLRHPEKNAFASLDVVIST